MAEQSKLNIVVPMGGAQTFFDEAIYKFPKWLTELRGKPMIQWVCENLNQIKGEKTFIFILRDEDCNKFHLDDTIRLLIDSPIEIIKLKTDTKGAACSCLLSIELINNDTPLVITNADQIIDVDLNKPLGDFNKRNLDAGVITFDSVHPKWSYVRLDESELVIETTEKRPISRNAIAGFYYYKSGKNFIESAFKMILKDSCLDGLFYISPTLNELILDSKKVGSFSIENNKYHSFYSPQKIKEFESV